MRGLSYLYKHAHDWQHHALPADVKDRLAGYEETSGLYLSFSTTSTVLFNEEISISSNIN